jgi:hypothetical protein
VLPANEMINNISWRTGNYVAMAIRSRFLVKDDIARQKGDLPTRRKLVHYRFYYDLGRQRSK